MFDARLIPRYAEAEAGLGSILAIKCDARGKLQSRSPPMRAPVQFCNGQFRRRKTVGGANASDELVKKLHIHNKYSVVLSAYVLLVCLHDIVILQ